MTIRRVTLEELKHMKFPQGDVLDTFTERYDREIKLRSAMAYTNREHDPVWIIVKLESGELVEIDSPMIDLEDNLVEVKGGFAIPLSAIYDVGV
jgi:hypothetical protein